MIGGLNSWVGWGICSETSKRGGGLVNRRGVFRELCA